ncbi:plasmid recombination protein [Elizabethkingia anophelis]|nr:plasmid recombination protein [Elizabethkingia anophelis]
MDEKTPHIHATIVPIVTGERRKSNKENNTPEKYKKKNPNINRLCADDVMARNKLKHYQNTYAVAMQKYGLKRGIEGSEAKHISTSEYYRDLYRKNELLSKEHREKQLELKELEKDISSKKIISNFANVLTGSKTKKLEKENELMKKEIQSITNLRDREKDKIQQSVSKLENDLEKQNKAIDKLMKYHPEIKGSLHIILECEKLGFNQDLIELLLEKKEIYIKGEIYSPQHFKSFSVDNLKLSIEYDDKEKTKVLKIGGLSSQNWFDEKYKESLRSKSQNNNHVPKSDMKNQR